MRYQNISSNREITVLWYLTLVCDLYPIISDPIGTIFSKPSTYVQSFSAHDDGMEQLFTSIGTSERRYWAAIYITILPRSNLTRLEGL
jgi:hypothetical protein